MVMWVPTGPGWKARVGTSAKTGAFRTADISIFQVI